MFFTRDTTRTTPVQDPQDVPINILSDVMGHAHTDQQRITQHSFVLQTQEVEHTRFDIEAPATILPKNSKFVSLIVDTQGNTFISSDKIYTTKMRYSLRGIIPPDSVLHGIVFQASNGTRPILGLFDASCVGGRCLMQNTCIERHSILHKAFRRAAKCPHIRMHWVGHERVLVDKVKYKRVTADFEIDCVARLQDKLSSTMTYCRLIPSEPITTLVPKLNPTKMLETLRMKRAKLLHAKHHEK